MIYADLKAIGVPQSKAKILSKGAGLHGKLAEKFINLHAGDYALTVD